MLLATSMIVRAYEHHDSRVSFHEYSDKIIELNPTAEQPYFLLFSAEWCHWCHVFAEQSLSREEVYTYLNRHFTNVFVDADIHTAAYVKYRATGFPFAVFLNPDGSVHFKYAGTLYGDDFLEVLRDIKTNVEQGIVIPGQTSTVEPYVPPPTLVRADLIDLTETFRQGVLDNFDPVEQGVGRGEKAVLPRTFLYLLEHLGGQDQETAVDQVGKTLRQAIATIYDPVEGGFFRYAETRDWQVPHYEKMADLNAGAALVLFWLNDFSASSELERAGTQTTDYLKTTLFEPSVGTFLSFQEADTYYFLLDADNRKTRPAPDIVDKIFTERLAVTLDYLSDVLIRTSDPKLENMVRQSLDFLAGVVETRQMLQRYYALADGQWRNDSGLRGHALVARLFQKASRKFTEPRYARVSELVLKLAFEKFYDVDKRIFVDPTFTKGDSVEYLMEMNGLLALTMMGLAEDGHQARQDEVNALITYFSGIGGVLEERLWDSSDWELMEAYVPYLEAIDAYLLLR